MDTGLLKAFLEVNRAKHFGRAAKNLFISQSAVSARIKQLEDEIGAVLFTRERNNIELTNAGRKFQLYAENILNTWHKAMQEIAIPEGAESLLNVAALPSIWDIFLEDWLSWVNHSNSMAALNVDVMRTDSLIRYLLDGTLDLGFVFDPPKTPELLVKELLPIPLIMVSSKPGLNAEDAINSHYVFVDWGTSFNMIHARQYPNMQAPMLRSTVGRLALNFLLNRGGSAYLPEAAVANQLGKSLHQVTDAPVIQKEAYALYAQASSKKTLIEQVLLWFEQSQD